MESPWSIGHSSVLPSSQQAWCRPNPSGTTVVVFFAPLRVFPEIKEIFAVAKDRGIGTILVTEIVDTSFSNEDSAILATPSTVLTDTENILAPLVVAHSLAHEVANLSSSKSIDAYNEMVERRERL